LEKILSQFIEAQRQQSEQMVQFQQQQSQVLTSVLTQLTQALPHNQPAAST